MIEQHPVACAFCGSPERKVLFRPRVQADDVADLLRVSSNINGTQNIVQCTQCGLVYVSPRIDPNVLWDSIQDAESGDYLSQLAQREKTCENGLDLMASHGARFWSFARHRLRVWAISSRGPKARLASVRNRAEHGDGGVRRENLRH